MRAEWAVSRLSVGNAVFVLFLCVYVFLLVVVL